MTKAGGNTTTTLDGTPIIVGAVLGSVFGVLLIAFFVWFFVIRKKKPKQSPISPMGNGGKKDRSGENDGDGDGLELANIAEDRERAFSNSEMRAGLRDAAAASPPMGNGAMISSPSQPEAQFDEDRGVSVAVDHSHADRQLVAPGAANHEEMLV